MINEKTGLQKLEDELLEEESAENTMFQFKDPIFTKFEPPNDFNSIFKIIKYLGKGGFGSTESAWHIKTGETGIALLFRNIILQKIKFLTF